MKTITSLCALLLGVVLFLQAPDANGQANRKAGKGPARDPKQSPASPPRPKSVTPQTYAADLIRQGEGRFSSQCGFCHGRDATGGESGPDLTRSELVAGDDRGDKLGPMIRAGRPNAGMPAFNLSRADLDAIVAFLHTQMDTFSQVGGGRRTVDPEDLAGGSAADGRRYFNGAGGCAKCHSPTGDLAAVGKRYVGLELLRRMLYPSGNPAPARPKATITLASGETITGAVAVQDEFSVTIVDAANARKTYQRNAVKVAIDDPMSAHFDQLGKYTDADMHNVYAYLASLQ